MRLRAVAATATLAAVCGSASAGTIVVPTDEPTIQEAIDAAVDGDVVLVMPGMYYEAIDLSGKSIVLRSQAGPDDTTIDGAAQGRSVITCASGEPPETMIIGFTITGGTGTGSVGARVGGGMYNLQSSPTVVECRFVENQADYGGGVENEDASPVFRGCLFEANSATIAGGGVDSYVVSVGDSRPQLLNCVFRRNQAGQFGGAASAFECDALYSNCVFSGNEAAGVAGGGVFNQSNEAVFVNCSFFGNVSPGSGGAIYNDLADAQIASTIVWGNGPAPIMDVASASSEVTHSCVEGGFTGETNVALDPLFADALGPDGVAGTPDDDLRLSPGSPCIDSGTNDPADPCAVDLDGLLRRADDEQTPDTGEGVPPIVDMGAYEFDSVPGDCNGNFIDDACDVADGTSLDCDGNGVPDECDDDCNGNGVPDACDITDGVSEDCNGNGVPDECDLETGFSVDCNGNEVPDECDVLQGTSLDCNQNLVPDECETDCNGNGTPDDCDIGGGESADVNHNGVPDECEIIGDRDGDGIVGVSDLVLVIVTWGPCPAPPALCLGDVNEDGTVGVTDLVLVILNWSVPSPPPGA